VVGSCSGRVVMPGLYDKLVEHARKVGEPLDAVIELTYRCSYRCGFCYVDHNAVAAKDELDAATWGRILEDLKAAGTISVLFTGGEVFVHKDCLDILRKAKELGFLTTVYTNASRIDRHTSVALGGLNLLDIGVTLYGATPATHDEYTGDGGSFERVILAGEERQKRGPGEGSCRRGKSAEKGTTAFDRRFVSGDGSRCKGQKGC